MDGHCVKPDQRVLFVSSFSFEIPWEPFIYKSRFSGSLKKKKKLATLSQHSCHEIEG